VRKCLFRPSGGGAAVGSAARHPEGAARLGDAGRARGGPRRLRGPRGSALRRGTRRGAGRARLRWSIGPRPPGGARGSAAAPAAGALVVRARVRARPKGHGSDVCAQGRALPAGRWPHSGGSPGGQQQRRHGAPGARRRGAAAAPACRGTLGGRSGGLAAQPFWRQRGQQQPLAAAWGIPAARGGTAAAVGEGAGDACGPRARPVGEGRRPREAGGRVDATPHAAACPRIRHRWPCVRGADLLPAREAAALRCGPAQRQA